MPLALAVALLAWTADDAPKGRKPFVPTTAYERREIEGWTVLVNKSLLTDRADLGRRALRLLDAKLAEVSRLVPPPALVKLREVPIWLGVDDGHAPCAEYHPSRDWLREHGYNPDKAKAVEIGNATRFLEWIDDQPMMVLHELSHAYLDRVLGVEHRALNAAYRKAQADGQYASVLRLNGKLERAYALTDRQEYFAEGSEAFFGTNDFYPFVRAELKNHDPTLYRVLREVWGRDY